MGSRSNSRRRRGTKRGLASFVSFVVLFALALGQGSTLVALAEDTATVDPVATEEVATESVSADAALPAREAPAEEAPAEEAPAEEAPAEEAPAEEAPAEEAPAEESSATSTSGAEPTRKLSSSRSGGRGTIAAAPGGGGFDGGDISLDYVAAGPFTYDHLTGIGGEFGDGHISKDDGVVESLESGDFACGDLVVFFTEVTVDDFTGAAGTIELDYSFGAETTGQPGLGFTDIVSVGVNTGDSGMTDTGTTATATLISETPDPAGNQAGYDQVLGTVEIDGLDSGDVIIVRLVARLGCIPGATPTGNILNAIEDGRVTGPTEDTISVGQQTVPMKTTGFIAAPSITIVKDCPAPTPFGDDISYDITITNDGNEDLENVEVWDTVNGNDPVDISNLFPDTLDAGDFFTAEFTYSPDGTEPDPLPNSATVTASGVFSETPVDATDACSTDITHVPGILVEKECPGPVAFGEDVTFTITVSNTGNEPLENVLVTDELLGGDITAAFELPDPLPVGTTEYSAQFTYTPGADEDPVENTVTASGDGVDSGDTATSEASCSTDITHVPGILVEKECPGPVAFGEDVTFTITVSNTGNEPLENVLVTDELLGGDITAAFELPDPLPVGTTEYSAQFTYTPGADEDPVENTVTASGDGVDSGDTATSEASCSTDITHVPGILVEKECPGPVAFGEDVTFTITVSNTGNEPLENVLVTDELLGGDITAAFELPDPLPVGTTEYSAQFTYTPGADEDPVENTVTASGDGVDSGDTATSEASCSTDITHPAIQIEKTVNDEIVPVGTTVTYTYVITNIGEVTLYNITVDDDIMGHIGDIPILEVDQSVTLTKDFVVGDEPVLNVATAEGEDGAGNHVSDTDDAFVTPIAGSNPPNPPNPPTPFTGSDAGRLGLITMVLFGIGVTVVASTRRRRPEREAA